MLPEMVALTLPGWSYVRCGILLSLPAIVISFYPKTFLPPRQDWLLFDIPWLSLVLSGLACVWRVVSEAPTCEGSENTAP